MVKKLNKKIVTLLIAFLISIVLSAVISTCLHLIFTKRPEEILGLNASYIINSILTESQNRQMFIIIIIAFMMLTFVSVFKVFKLNNYYAKTYKVTPDIEIPMPVGKSQTQHRFCLVA